MAMDFNMQKKGKIANQSKNKLLEKREKIRTSVVEELDGQTVRIPGYLLPLELIGDRVNEFLLVPYVGACIHVPPPPLNQIVSVKIVGKEDRRLISLF